jgi:hypothetical protein
VDPLADALKRELKGLGPNSAMSETVEAWPDAVGAEFARNAWPARFQRDGTLIVHTKDAIWGFELGHRAAEISARLPGKPALKFVPGPLPEPAAEEPAQAAPAATLEERRQAAEWAEAIEDEGLREAVKNAASASLAARRDSRDL